LRAESFLCEAAARDDHSDVPRLPSIAVLVHRRSGRRRAIQALAHAVAPAQRLRAARGPASTTVEGTDNESL